MVGELAQSGVGTASEVQAVSPVDELRANVAKSNRRTLQGLREDEHSHELWEASIKDAALGRLSPVVLAKDFPVEDVLLHPRFAVVQTRPDLSLKVRAVDNLSWCAVSGRKADSVNGHTALAEKMSHDTLDALGEALAHFVAEVGVLPGLLKADIDAAFRRIPIRPVHRWTCGIAFKVDGSVGVVPVGGSLSCPGRGGWRQVFAARHHACPFGAVASGHAWERCVRVHVCSWGWAALCLRRLGAALCQIARVFLSLPLLRYVDDYFGPDRYVRVWLVGGARASLRAVPGAGWRRWSMAWLVSRGSLGFFLALMRWRMGSLSAVPR